VNETKLGTWRATKSTILTGLMLLSLLTLPAFAGNTYITDLQPNVEVTEPDCHSFTIMVNQGSGTTATLSLHVFDVDEEQGELDEVSLNGTLLGYLSGTSDTWSTTNFDVTSEIIYGGLNTVEICIDPDGGEDSIDWVAEIDWGQILVDGGSAEDADIESLTASGTWNSIQVETLVSATNSAIYRLEINLLDSANNNKAISIDVFDLTAGSNSTRRTTLSLPSEPTGTETFTVEANLFNNTTGVQQSLKTTPWTYSSEPPTDITLSADHLDENLPPLSLVGVLDAIDSDSTSHTFALLGGDATAFTIIGDQLRSTQSFDYEIQSTYNLLIEAEDNDENTISEWFTITVVDVNEAPVARDDTSSVMEGAGTEIAVLDNDTDPEQRPLEISDVSVPSQGTATIRLGRTILYAPNPGACGLDTFGYTIEDDEGNTATAAVSIEIQNLPPTAVDDVVEVQEDKSVVIDVLANDSDPGSGTLFVESVEAPANGSVLIVGSSIRYSPRPRFEGSDQFSYTLRDTCGATAIALVSVDVLHTNHPPIANAGTFYQGIVGKPLVLSALFSTDPDVEDILQYRWDLDGDGTPDTNWSTDSRLIHIFHEPFFGQITLEVRDIYKGIPAGGVAQATALLRIAPIQSLQVFVFEDLDSNGVMDPFEPGLPDIHVDVAGKTWITEVDGGITVELDVGQWTVSITEDAVSQLRNRGFQVLQAIEVVNLTPNEVKIIALGVRKIATRLKGIVYSDDNANGEWDKDDRPVENVSVIIDGDKDHAVVTDSQGSFAFRDVLYGSHEVYVEQTGLPEGETPLSILIPFTLIRTEKAEIHIPWPYALESQGGFLQVEVQQGGDE